MTITISVSELLWTTLNIKKEPGQSFEDVIWKLISKEEVKDEPRINTP